MFFRTYVRLWKTWKGQNEVPWVIKTAANVHRGCFSIYIAVFADFIVKFEQILRILMVSSEAATGGGLYKKVFFKKFVKFTGKHLCQRPLFNKVVDWKKYVKFRKQNTASSHIYPFYITVLFLHPVKASANQSFSDAFREYRERTVA